MWDELNLEGWSGFRKLEMERKERMSLGGGTFRSLGVQAVKSKALTWRLRVQEPDWFRGILLASPSLQRAGYQVLVWFCHLLTMCGLGQVMQHQPRFLHPSYEVNTFVCSNDTLHKWSDDLLCHCYITKGMPQKVAGNTPSSMQAEKQFLPDVQAACSSLYGVHMQSSVRGTRVTTLLFLRHCSNLFNCKTFLELQPPHKISHFLLFELYTHPCKHMSHCVGIFFWKGGYRVVRNQISVVGQVWDPTPALRNLWFWQSCLTSLWLSSLIYKIVQP